jgi:peptide-methionine (S)-S-oxide reductase
MPRHHSGVPRVGLATLFGTCLCWAVLLVLLPACRGSAVGNSPPGEPETPAAANSADPTTGNQPDADMNATKPAGQPAAKGTGTVETATFGAGCYWCTEAVLQQLDGVLEVTSGFMGGTVPDPSYELVCTGTTGYAEVVQVKFDPARISYQKLLEWFWKLHDPTSLNRQGADEGTQYRSVIFYHSQAQHQAALESKAAAQKSFTAPIVTEITKAGPFYQAEADHQDFYRRNQDYGYCRVVIKPKLHKLGLDK